jgi:hypothetical protein
MKTLIKLAARMTGLALAAVLSFSAACSTPLKQAAPKDGQLTESCVWYDGSREQTVWLNPQMVAEFNPGKLGVTAAKGVDANATMQPMKQSQAGVRLWKINNTGGMAVRGLMTSNPSGNYSPVFHDSPSNSGRMRALPGNIIVYLDPQWDEAKVSSWLNSHTLEKVKKLEIGSNVYVIKTAPGLAALDMANMLYRSGEVKAAFPDWWQEVAAR